MDDNVISIEPKANDTKMPMEINAEIPYRIVNKAVKQAYKQLAHRLTSDACGYKQSDGTFAIYPQWYDILQNAAKGENSVDALIDVEVISKDILKNIIEFMIEGERDGEIY